MGYAQLFHQRGREDTRRKGTPKDPAKFRIKAANAHVLELKVGLYDGIRVHATSVHVVGIIKWSK